MRLPIAFAALGLAGLAFTALPVADVQAQDTPSFSDKFSASISRGDGKLKIKFEGKKVGDEQWYMNREYPMNVKISGNATVGKAELTKDDATFEGTEVAGKAKVAAFATTITAADKATINYKVVVCSEKSCSPPIKVELKEP